MTIQIGFHEPFSGAWVEGEKTLFIRKAADKIDILDRYEAALKKLYGETAEVKEKSRLEGNKMIVHITPSTSSSKDYDFFSLRAALEWAKQKGITELYLKKIVIKSPDEEVK